MKLVAVLALAASTLLTACGTVRTSSFSAQPAAGAPSTVITLTATGYGAVNTAGCQGDCERVSPAQRKLLAMRASRLDAYRAMAEQVYGVRVEGGSTAGSLALKDDSFKVYIDAFIRGARVTNTAQREDGTYETTVEMDFDPHAAQYQPQGATQPAVAKNARTMVGNAGPGAAYGASFYHAQ
ncbi:LPP20 family lipoprotein [Massilia haematophila]|uniref:LPP20 family lipoprotein n=1 Tax=Massilia haematophila TaxID=457923 RepID=A0ABV7PNU6_9BURK